MPVTKLRKVDLVVSIGVQILGYNFTSVASLISDSREI